MSEAITKFHAEAASFAAYCHQLEMLVQSQQEHIQALEALLSPHPIVPSAEAVERLVTGVEMEDDRE